MRRLIVLFLALLGVFAGIWASRAGNPSNRPDSYAGGLSEGEYWWSNVQAEEVSSNWQLSAGVPGNYIPVPGRPGLYMIVDEDGYITGYRKGTKREDGGWDWEDVNPDIPENYEAVPGLDNVYKVTGDDGSVRYFRYIRNKNDTFAFVEVDARGNMIGEKVPSGSEIPENYERITRNKFAVKNSDGVIIAYKERVPDSSSGSGFTWVNIDEPDLEQLELPEIGFDLKTDVTGTGDITGGIREIAGFTDNSDPAAVPTLMPSGSMTASTGEQGSAGGFVFRQPEVRIDITQTMITAPPFAADGSSGIPDISPEPREFSFSGEITDPGAISVPPVPSVTMPPESSAAAVPQSGGAIPSMTVENSGYYQSTETSYSQKQEGNYIVTYAVSVEKTYDSQGNLIGTKNGDPVEVARQEMVSASSSGSPAATLSEEYSRICGLLASSGGSFNASVPNSLVMLLNTERGNAGLAALTFNGSSPAYQLALCRAAMMALSSSSNSSLPGYGKLSDMCSKYDVSTGSPSENMLITSASSTEGVHAALQNSSGNAARMSASYTEIAVAVVEKDGRFYIDEVFIR